MKKLFYKIGLLLAIVLTISCSKNKPIVIDLIEPITEKEQLIYENFTPFTCDTSKANEYQKECKELLSDRFIINDIYGIIDSSRKNFIYPYLNQTFDVDKKRFPKWIPLYGELIVYNMPKDIKFKTKERKIKINVNIFYLAASLQTRPQGDGAYPVELTRLEILK